MQDFNKGKKMGNLMFNKLVFSSLVSIGLVLGAHASSADSFIITVQTNNPGDSLDTQFEIPTYIGTTYDYDVDCNNDGILEAEGETGNYTCSYGEGEEGSYTIAIDGNFTQIYFNGEGDAEKILTVNQWGTTKWRTMFNAFDGASNLNITDTLAPDLSNVTTMYNMFNEASTLNVDLNNWDVSNVSDMRGVFQYATLFNGNISNWNVSKVTNMFNMFLYAENFNQDISDWNVSIVEDMTQMFWRTSFNHDIGNWDVSTVKRMSSMFYSTPFDQNISSWDVSNTQYMTQMFSNASNFNQGIGNWNTSNVKDMRSMFYNASSFNQDIGDWNTSNVTDIRYMFKDASSFNQDIGDWNLTEATSFVDMLTNTPLSISNYDNLLISLNAQSTLDSITFMATASSWCQGDEARTALMDDHSWIFDDLNLNCNYYINSSNTMSVESGSIEVGTITVDSEAPHNFMIIGGTDGNKFSIDSNGVLSFNEAPDYNNPTDSNTNNVYRVQIRASDEMDTVNDVQTIKVTVTKGSSTAIVPVISYILF